MMATVFDLEGWTVDRIFAAIAAGEITAGDAADGLKALQGVIKRAERRRIREAIEAFNSWDGLTTDDLDSIKRIIDPE